MLDFSVVEIMAFGFISMGGIFLVISEIVNSYVLYLRMSAIELEKGQKNLNYSSKQ
jgi:hypothetical protein